MRPLDQLIKEIAKFPGVGKKSASRIAFYLLKSPPSYNLTLSRLIGEIQEKVHPCSICGHLSESKICYICDDPSRNREILCVVEQPQDVFKIEATREFTGYFHVLGGLLSPLDGVGPEELRLSQLCDRIRKDNVREIIVATNPTPEGDNTALFISHLLQDSEVEISRIATGLPIGGDMEYADTLSIAHSMRSRRSISPKE